MTMFKQISISSLLLISILFSNLTFASKNVVIAKVTLRDGQTISALDISSIGLNNSLIGTYINGKKYKLAALDIAALEFYKVRGEKQSVYIANSELMVTLKNGKSSTASKIEIAPWVKISYLDDFTEKRVTQKFSINGIKNLKIGKPTDVIRIDFISMGDMKYSSSSDTYFSPSFSYDPYTGEPLVAKDISRKHKGKFIQTTSEDDPSGQNIKERLLTKSALDYAKVMMNPLVNTEEKNEALSIFVESASTTFK